MLKNDTLKNGTSRMGLYGSVPPGFYTVFETLGSLIKRLVVVVSSVI